MTIGEPEWLMKRKDVEVGNVEKFNVLTWGRVLVG